MLPPSAPVVAATYTIYPEYSDGRSRTRRRLEAIYSLGHGWHYGEGKAPEPQALHTTERLYAVAASLSLHTDVFPQVDGSVMLSVYLDDSQMDFIAGPSGAVTVFRETDGKDEELGDGVGFIEAINLLREQTPHLWTSFALSTEATSIANAAVSNPTPSRLLTEESRWFAFPALQNKAHQFVNT